ncbi:MAG: TetR/AcrR family transcriptional regulator [Actinobacteria bacterium]|nr:MAG: TetR/AcrR family transcriptional regulator [Actinomycetota bacterium]
MASEQGRGLKTEPGPAGPLPRGRHDLAPEEVRRHQRERIVGAVAKEMASRGYGDLTVGQIISEARVSRTTFYAQFANKREAVAGAHEIISDRFVAILEEACGREREWPLKVKAGIEAILDFAYANPEQARLLAVRLDGADVVLGESVRASQRRLLELLAEGRSYPAAVALPQITEEALVGAISIVISRVLDRGSDDDYATLRLQLVEFILAFYLGAGEASRVAAGSG